MLHRKITLGSVAALASIAVMTMAPSSGHAQSVTKIETKCSSKLAKAASKQAKTYLKQTSKCRDADIKGKDINPVCPTPDDLVKIDKQAGKVIDAAEKRCGSFCEITSTIPCMSQDTCPPRIGTLPEQCTAPEGGTPDGKNNFDMGNLGFPGPLCDTISIASDLGQCVADIENVPAQALIDAVYGSIDSTDNLSSDAAKCLKIISKSAQKLSKTVYKMVIKCRTAIQKGKVIGDQASCRFNDPKVAAKIVKAEEKLEKKIQKKCLDEHIQDLDLCLNGVGGTLTVSDAIDCVRDATVEITDTLTPAPQRTYSAVSLTETVYPPNFAFCGDGVRNQDPNPFLLLGEECDLDDDDACPGQCVPPGDVFECTCPGSPRQRFVADGFTADLDSGWSGTSHNQGVTDGAGYIYSLTNCNCSAFDPVDTATCTSTSDSLCDVSSIFQQPTCSWDPFSATRCDDHNNTVGPNGTDTDADCFICDDFSANSGDSCRAGVFVCSNTPACANNNACKRCLGDGLDDLPCSSSIDCGGDPCLQFAQCNGGRCERGCTSDGQCASSGGSCIGDCESQCYNLFDNTLEGTPCREQADCPTGTACRGRCDDSQTCLIVPNGAPLPISSGGTAVCVDTTFRENIFGTQDIVTGEHEHFIQQFSKVHLGTSLFTPCPVCGGFCDPDNAPGALAGRVCEGICSVTTSVRCRFDSDCPTGETCTPDAPECGGADCILGLVCGGGPNVSGPNEGNPCRIEAATTLFGTVSNDCPPSPGKNISGQGLEINFLPQTSEPVSHTGVLTCSNPAFPNFTCPCPGAGGLPTRPNLCAFACNAGAEFGQGCATGGGNVNGSATKCSGGGFLACDEDADCADEGGGTCSANPTHCDPLDSPAIDAQKICTTNGDCGGGTCVDACPSGRCVPLCVQADDPLFPPGFGGQSADDPEEGLCAAGPNFAHCNGETSTFLLCADADAVAGCSAVCAASCSASGVPAGGSGGPCDELSDCPTGEVCCGDCDLSRACGAGDDGIFGNTDDQPGAGQCILDARNCYINDGAAEGGDTINGNGDPTNVLAVSAYCVAGTSNNAVNSTAGLGGPGRLRQQGVSVPSFATLP